MQQRTWSDKGPGRECAGEVTGVHRNRVIFDSYQIALRPLALHVSLLIQWNGFIPRQLPLLRLHSRSIVALPEYGSLSTSDLFSSCSQERHCRSETMRLGLELLPVSSLSTSTSCYNLENLTRETSVCYVPLPLLHTPFGCLVASVRRFTCSMAVKQLSYLPMGAESHLMPVIPSLLWPSLAMYWNRPHTWWVTTPDRNMSPD